MRFLLGAVVVVIACCAAGGTVSAQPITASVTDPLPPNPSDGTTNTKIPITMAGGTEVMGAESEGHSTNTAGISLEQPIDPDLYLCGPGDQFELNFWGQQNFRLRFAANLEGKAFISKVGFVGVNGKTLTVVRTEVHRKVRANYPGLNFELTLVSPRSFQVHIVNFVKQPGSYVAHPLERVSTVLTQAGGITGSRRNILVRRRRGGDVVADLVKYELTGDTQYNPFVLDGDVISVPAAKLVINVAGAVRRPGTYELVGSQDLAEVFDLAGGFTSAVVRTLPVRVVRRNAQQRDEFVDVPFKGDAAPNVALKDDDQVLVRGTDELRRTVLLIGAIVGADPLDTATTMKRLNFVEGDTVLSLITRAGGIKAPGDLRRSYISRPKVAPGNPDLIPIDLDALLVRRDFSADKPIMMNDTIVIPSMRYSVLVEGAVNRGGLYPFNPKFGIAEYIAMAGGRTRSARDLDESKIIDANGATFDYGKDRKPNPGDSILVPERNFTRAEVVQIVMAGAGLLLSGIAITLAATR
jgi:protein involved in polysaccharide export with SLBB domain